jgi:hypothetical protein
MRVDSLEGGVIPLSAMEPHSTVIEANGACVSERQLVVARTRCRGEPGAPELLERSPS